MRKIILLSLFILICISGFAQNIRIEESKVKESDDQVFVSFIVVADKIKSNERLTLIPTLYNGDKSQTLTPIIIVGYNRAISDKRHNAVQGIRTKHNQRIPYALSVPYQSWMADVSLRVDRKIESCCTEQMLVSQAVAQNRPIRYDVTLPKIEVMQEELSPLKKLDAETPFLAPMTEYKIVKENFDVMRAEGALIIHFRQGKKIIDPTFEENGKSLTQIINVLDLIAKDPATSIGKIVLAGASSPEGTAKLNDFLAEQRIQVLRDFLNSKTTLSLSQIESVNIGEDWTGLRKMVEQSNMQYKNEVLDIIDYVPVMKGREKQLMDLKQGGPYNYMKEHFFPKLRSAGYIRVFYESKPDAAFERSNEAIELYNNKEYRDALIRLEGVKSTAATENIRGVCHMMLGEYDKAGAALNKAVELGNTEATESLRQLEKLKAVQR